MMKDCKIMAFKQGGIFIVPLLLWYGASVVSAKEPPHEQQARGTVDILKPGAPWDQSAGNNETNKKKKMFEMDEIPSFSKFGLDN